MKRLVLLSTAVAVAVGGYACKQSATQAPSITPVLLADGATPATQPALPDGHPPVGAPGLPSGHPDVNTMPPGMGGMGGMGGQMPPGHPPTPAPAKRDAKPVDVVFSIQAIQQTKNAPAIGSLPASIEFILDEQPVGQKIEFKLDAKGAANVPAKGVPSGAVGYITVKHQDVEYHAISAPVDGSRAQTKVGIGVFETTTDAVNWHVGMQHVILQPGEKGLNVMQMLSVENPTDKSWLGTPGADGKRSTVSFPVPPTSGDILPIDGFKDGFVKLEGDLLFNQLPLTPGPTQYRISYTIPYENGKASMNYKTTSLVKHVMLFAPDDGTSIEVKGLESMGPQQMGEKKIRAFMGKELPAGTQIELNIGQPAQLPAGHSEADHDHSDPVRQSSMPAVSSASMAGGQHLGNTGNNAAADTVQIAKTIAIAGTVLVLLLAGALMFAKPQHTAKRK